MPTRRASALLLVTVAASGGSIAAIGKSPKPLATARPATWNGLVGSRPDVALPARSIIVLRTPSLAARVRAAGGHATRAQERAWTAAARAAQDALVQRLAGRGIQVVPELRFTRVLDGFSAKLDPATAARLERDRDVLGVYPDRVAYPATTAAQVLASPAFADGSGHRIGIAQPGLTGKGVTIALLDTRVDRDVRFLHGAVLPEIDVVGPTRGERAAERHGTEMAGLLVGAGGPGGLAGVAPGARVQPIRVAGRQRDSRGSWTVFARGDQIVAGLDRAVDPNGDGDAHDALPVALVAVAEPYAGFADSPESLAVSGALALGTLVVAPAGNDGPGAPRFGDLSGPGGAPGALTVGAVDTRPSRQQVRVSLHAGGTDYAGTLPLAGAVAPAASLHLDVSEPRASGSTLSGFFSASGASLVAGEAALVTPGTAPAAIVRRAATAGASAVLVGGPAPLAAGALPVDAGANLPVVSIPRTVTLAVRRALAAGGRVSVTISPVRAAANPVHLRAAAFSSTGLSFGGAVKPELAAPGVSLATADPNGTSGEPRWVTVSGTSAAAAAAAGAVALVAQARPSLDAAELASLLAGHAATLGGPLAAQGGGLVDVQSALAAQTIALPATLSLADGDVTLSLVNVGKRATVLQLGSAVAQGGSYADLSLSPATVRLAPGRAQRVHVHIAVTPVAGAPVAQGVVDVAPVGGGAAVQIPWATRFPARHVSLLGRVRLSRHAFSASDVAPAVLAVDAGRLFGASAHPDVRALSRLDVELFRGKRRLGLLARLRDVLPGRYTFGLTGRGPSGRVLARGHYAVEVVAVPVGGGAATTRKLPFDLR